MSDLDTTELQRSIDALNATMSNGRNTGNSAAPPGQESTGGGGIDKATTELSLITQSLKAIATGLEKIVSYVAGAAGMDAGKLKGIPEAASGMLALKDSSFGASRAIDLLAGKVPVVGQIMEMTGYSLSGLLKVAQEGSKLGVGQGAPLELEARARAAGFKDANELFAFLKENYGQGMRVIGKSAEDSNTKFLEFAKKTIETDLGKRLIENSNYTAAELAKVAAIAAQGKTDMLRTEEGRAALAEKTAQLASKIDAQVQVTGESRDAVIRDLLTRQQSTKAQLDMQALSNDKERQNYLDNQKLFAGMGEDMQKVVGTIQAGGRLSPEMKATLQVATGGRAGQLIQLLREQKRTAGLDDSDPVKIAANKKLDDFISKMNEYQKSQLFAQQLNATSNSALRAAGERIAEQNKIAGAQLATQRESRVSPEVAAQRVTEGYGMAGQRGERQESILEKTPVPVYGAELFKELAVANEQLRKNASGAATAISELSEALVKNTNIVGGMKSAAGAVGLSPKTQEDTNRVVKDAITEALKLVTPGGGGAIPGVTELGNINANNVEITSPQVTITQPAVIPSTAPSAALPSRGTGTFGETGFSTEIKDIVAQLHKGESVLTPNQRAGMIIDSANAAFDSLLGKMSKNVPSDLTAKIPTIEVTSPTVTETTNKTMPSLDAMMTNASAMFDKLLNSNKTTTIDKELSGMSDQTAGMMKDMQSKLSNPEKLFGDLKSAFNDITLPGPNLIQEFKNFQSPASNIAEPAEEIKASPNNMILEQKETVTLKDLNDQLIQLNSNIKQLVSHGSSTAEYAEQQVRATKSLSGNRFA